MEPGLEETAFYDPENFVFPFGAHAAVVEVDAETGKVDVVRYVAVDDCGPAINPMLIDGQVHGGIVHSIGQALYERIHYDENGQLVTGTFVDYCIPSAADVPRSRPTARRRRRRRTRSASRASARPARSPPPRRSSTRSSTRCAAGVTFINMPLTPKRVWEATNCERRRAMIPAEFDYVAPDTLEEALGALPTAARTRSSWPAGTRCCR